MRAALCSTLLLCACGDWHQPEGLTEADRALIRLMVLPSEAAPDPTNRFADSCSAALLGQSLFFDTELSMPAGVSCASCHDANAWFIDTRSQPNNLSQGVLPASGVRTFTKRNSPSLVNVAHYRWWPWDGRSDSLWMQCAVAHESDKTMAGSRARLARRMDSKYGWVLGLMGIGFMPFELTDDGAAERAASVGYKAMAAYLRRLNSADSRFDRFASGDEEALNEDEKAGLALFLGKAGCIECHNGPAFNGAASARSEADFYKSVGIGQRGDNVQAADLGHWDGIDVLTGGKGAAVYSSAGFYNDVTEVGLKLNRTAVVRREEDKGRFRIKSLRQVAKSAPFMHAGQLATLADVVHFYNTGGDPDGYAGERDRVLRPLELTPLEEQQLVAFLETLTGRAVAGELTCDPSGNVPCDPFTACMRRAE